MKWKARRYQKKDWHAELQKHESTNSRARTQLDTVRVFSAGSVFEPELSNHSPLQKRREGLTNDHVIHQWNPQHLHRTLHALRVVHVIRGGLMIPGGIASYAQKLLGSAGERVSHHFPRVDHDSMILAARYLGEAGESLLAVQEECGERHAPLDSALCQESLELWSARAAGMLTLMKPDAAPNPVGVRLLSLEAVVSRPDILSHDIEYVGRFPVHLPISVNCRIFRAPSKEIMDLLSPSACYMTRVSQNNGTVLSHSCC